MTLVSQTIPFHPLPLDGESISSYLCRVCEYNQIKNIPTLQSLLFPDIQIRNLRDFNEHRPGNMKTMYKSLHLKSSDIKTSLWNISINFGRPSSPQASSKFLGSLIDSYRKFCPLCLSERKEIYLVWKFKTVSICLNHNIFLVNQCLKCNRKIKNLPKNLSNTICPYCFSDLSIQSFDRKINKLTYFEQEKIQSNLNFLLKKVKININENLRIPSSEIIGQKLKQIRLEKGFSVPSFSNLSGLKIYDIENIEYGLNSRGIGDLMKYFNFLSCLNLSITNFFKL